MDTNTENDIYAIVMKYMVKENISLKKYDCDANATMTSFTECIMKNIEDYECSIAINKIGNLFNETKFCKNHTRFYEINNKTQLALRDLLFSKNESQPNCMRPCKSVRYPFSLLKYHKSGKILLPGIETNGAFLLAFGYDDLVMDKKKEYLVMDRGGLISTVGGFLGLFLGSSCVSIIEWLANQTKGYIKV